MNEEVNLKMITGPFVLSGGARRVAPCPAGKVVPKTAAAAIGYAIALVKDAGKSWYRLQVGGCADR